MASTTVSFLAGWAGGRLTARTGGAVSALIAGMKMSRSWLTTWVQLAVKLRRRSPSERRRSWSWRKAAISSSISARSSASSLRERRVSASSSRSSISRWRPNEVAASASPSSISAVSFLNFCCAGCGRRASSWLKRYGGYCGLTGIGFQMFVWRPTNILCLLQPRRQALLISRA
jgi:hypothetical protein